MRIMKCGRVRHLRTCSVILCAALAACSDENGDKLRAANLEITLLQSRLQRLEKWQLSRPDPQSGHLELADEGFTVIETDLGRLSFQLKSAKPEGTGSRVVLRVGNPMAVTITELSMHVDYGANGQDSLPDYSAMKSIERIVTTPIKAGMWNTVSLMLPDVPPNRLAYLDISKLVAKSITLYGANS